MGLKGFANLPEIVEQGKSMASPHAAGRGHEPDTCLFNETFTVASDGTPEMGQTFTGIQAKNFTGTRGAEHKAEVSGNKAKNLENTPAVDHQTKPKVTVTETGETLVRYDIHHLVTFMLGKPKLDRGASKYYVDEKVWHDLEDKETIENLHQMEDYSTMDKYLE